MHRKHKPTIKSLEYPKISLLYGEPVAFHSEYYNLYLQKLIENTGYGINSEKILVDGAATCVYSMLSRLFEKNSHIHNPGLRLQIASDIYSSLGFGLLPTQGLTIKGGNLTTQTTHYTNSWKKLWGDRDRPVDYFTCGYLQATMAVAFYQPLWKYKVKQTKCLTMRNTENEFVIELNSEYKQYPIVPGIGVFPAKFSSGGNYNSNIDETKINNWMQDILSSESDSDGFLSCFGISMTKQFANYHNYISFEMEKELINSTGDSLLAREILIEAANYCSFYTFGNIMKTEEWYQTVVPYCKNREDWIFALITCINNFGWGNWDILKISSGDKLLVQVHGGYESNFYLRNYPAAKFPKSYLVTGCIGGMMNLLYNIDITQKPELNDEFFHETFDTEFSFIAVQTSSRCMGDDYCEFEARGLF